MVAVDDRSTDVRRARRQRRARQLLQDGYHLLVGVHIRRTDVNDKTTFCRHDVVLGASLYLRGRHLDGAQQGRLLLKLIAAQTVYVIQGYVEGVDALIASGMACFADSKSVEHHQSTLGYGTLHTGRLTHNAHEPCSLQMGHQVRDEGSRAVDACHLFLGRQGKNQVEGQPLLVEMQEGRCQADQ